MTKFMVEMYADTVCPWCYINKRTVDAAIEKHQAQYPEDVFEVVWKPYLLHPNAKVSAYNKKDTFLLKFGPDAPLILSRVQRAGTPHGLTFAWDGRTGSSRDSHKLILLAASQDAAPSTPITTSGDTSRSTTSIPPRGPGAAPPSHTDADPQPESTNSNPDSSSSGSASGAVYPLPSQSQRKGNGKLNTIIEALFSGAQTQNKDISSRAFLVPIALAHGLASTEEEILAYLDSEEANARVDAEAARARGEIGIAAVPSVVVNERYRVGGMQEEGVYLGLFERIRGGGG